MDALTVPGVLLLGNTDVHQAPVLPGSVDKSAAVFRVDCLLVGLLRKGQRTEATQKPCREEKCPDSTSISALSTQLLALSPMVQILNCWLNKYARGLLCTEACACGHERCNPICAPGKLVCPAEPIWTTCSQKRSDRCTLMPISI